MLEDNRTDNPNAMNEARGPRWMGRRGEGYVVVQILLFALVIFGPRRIASWPPWAPPWTTAGSIVGGALLGVGTLLLFAGVAGLGTNLSALPHPKDDATFRDGGAFRIVRHPMYSGGILMALGWGLFAHAWLTIGYAVLLFIFFDFKARREERMLQMKFPEYPAYQKRVRRLVPFIY
jgi:protein-S-isoprenylcysteine O-methyltransferase Ste14